MATGRGFQGKTRSDELRVRGLVVREVLYGDSDKILSVLTAEYGMITVSAKGARSMKSRYLSSAQLMSYSDMTLSRRADRYSLRDAVPLETFYPVRLDLEGCALVQYFFDICSDICPEGSTDSAEAMLQLLLNTLYAIMTKKKPLDQIKAAFELRTAVISGLAPDLSGCSECGCTDSPSMLLDLVGGTVRCRDCVMRAEKESSAISPDRLGATPVSTVSPTALAAMRFISEAPAKRFLSYTLPDEYTAELGAICEAYLCNQLERGFNTLEFWHSVSEGDKQSSEQI